MQEIELKSQSNAHIARILQKRKSNGTKGQNLGLFWN
jgi:hypothetical protein